MTAKPNDVKQMTISNDLSMTARPMTPSLTFPMTFSMTVKPNDAKQMTIPNDLFNDGEAI